MGKNTPLKKNEQGIVAIVVTVFFMMVLTLIVLAFSQAARREQRQSLDNQLQKQAFYAAESGINDTMHKIETGTPPYDGLNKSDCTDPLDTTVYLTEDKLISYSCVLYNKVPDRVTFQSIGTSQGETVSLKTSTGTLRDVKITWRDDSGSTTTSFTGCPTATDRTFPPAASGGTDCDAGTIRVLIMPFKGAKTRSALVDDSFTVFLRPTKDGTTSEITYAAYGSEGAVKQKQGTVVPVLCTGGICSMTIKDLPNVAGTENFINIRSIDKANAVEIDGTLYGGSKGLFTDAQIEIDVTGKANDVIRRLKVRKPTKPQYEKAPFALEVLDGICKQLELYPGQGSDAYTNCFPDVLPTSPDYKGPKGID